MKDDWTPGCDVKADVPDDQKGRHYDVFEEVAVVAHAFHRFGLLKAIFQGILLARCSPLSLPVFNQVKIVSWLTPSFAAAPCTE